MVSYFLYGSTSVSTTQASVSLFTGSTGGFNIGASTAPFTQTTQAPVSVTGTTMIASGSFLTTITTPITWNVTVNVYAGSISTYRGFAYANFTRIG
jgi:hypothetical protein